MNKTWDLPSWRSQSVINVLNIPLIIILTTIYYMPANVLSILNAFSHIILPINLWKDGIIYPSFTDDETKKLAQCHITLISSKPGHKSRHISNFKSLLVCLLLV